MKGMQHDRDGMIMRIRRERRVLAALIADTLFVEHAKGPDLRSRYLRRFGWLEYDNLVMEWRIARLRRQTMLIASALESGEPVYLPALEYRLDMDMLDWNRKLNRKREELREAEAGALFERSARRRGEVHARLVDALELLHPALRPGRDRDRQRLWEQLLTAYQHGDIAEFDELHRLATDILGDDLDTIGNAGASRFLVRLDQDIVDAKHVLDGLRNDIPMTYASVLADDAAIEQQEHALKRRLTELGCQLRDEERTLAELLRSLPHE